MSIEYRVGDVFDELGKIPDGTIDLIVTSPPFLALRSYLPADHPDKAKEIGSEATPAAFIDTLLALTAEFGRVLAPHGSLCLELGDTYSGSGGGDAALSYRMAINGERSKGGKNGKRDTSAGWPLAKSLTGIPTLYPWSLAYGRNLLTGQESPAGLWRIRNVIVWARPNPPVGCVDDLTEALTPDGWKRHGDLRDGDLIAAYDKATDSCRFLPATFVRWHRDGDPMVSIEKRSTSQLLTLDHRALTRTRKRGVHVRLADDLTNDCDTLLAAPFDDIPGPAPLTVERAELLGWYIAEGSTHHRQARIVQSVSANPQKVDRIRHLLERDAADVRESVYGRGASSVVTFHVKGELAEWLNLHHKRLPMQYVTTWPEAQARALFDGLIDGDGHRRTIGRGHGILFHQKDEAIADGVQVLALRLGYRATKSYQPSMGLWQITIGRNRWTAVRKWDGVGIPRTTYTGIVWCPQIETSFWLARRNGRTFVTGNSLGDKFRPATSYITVACKGAKRYFDLDAVRGPGSPNTHARLAQGVESRPTNGKKADNPNNNYGSMLEVETAGAPPLDWHTDHHPEDGDWLWKMATAPYPGAHYATYPLALPTRLIRAMCPQKVCVECGKPSERITRDRSAFDVQPILAAHIKERREAAGVTPAQINARLGYKEIAKNWERTDKHGAAIPNAADWAIIKPWLGLSDEFDEAVTGERRWTESTTTYEMGGSNGEKARTARESGFSPHMLNRANAIRSDLGWSDCGHNQWRTGIVLDPFAGSATTLEAAQAVGRHAIGIDLDERNADLARNRVGMFLEITQ